MEAKPRTDAPHGMEPYDVGGADDELGALSDEQQAKLNQLKVFEWHAPLNLPDYR